MDENVLAYSNRFQGRSALVVYNNKFSQASGWIKTSCAKATRAVGDKRQFSRRNLADSLGINPSPGTFTIFRDQMSGLEFIRSSAELYDNGLQVNLNAFECQVLLDFRQVKDDQWKSYSQLWATLGGRGVPDIEFTLQEMNFQPVLLPFQELANKHYFEHLLASRIREKDKKLPLTLTEAYQARIVKLVEGAAQVTGKKMPLVDVAGLARKQLETILSMQVDRKPVSPSCWDAL